MTAPAARLRTRLAVLRAAAADDRGSMPLAMALMVFTIVAAVAIAATITSQVAAARSELAGRSAGWALDSALAKASHELGATDRFLTGLPADGAWTEAEDGTHLYRWQVRPDEASTGTSAVAVPALALVASGHGTLLGITPGGRVLTSPDAVTWTPVGTAPLPVAAIDSLAATPSGWAIVPHPRYGTPGQAQAPLHTSLTGATWTPAGSPGTVPADGDWTARLACSSSACVLLHTRYDGAGLPDTARYYSAPTSLTAFTLRADTTTTPAAVRATALAYGNGTFLAVGATATGTPAAATSTDATTWSSTALTGSATPTGVAYSAGRFLAIAAGTTSAWRTADADTFTAVTLPAVAAHVAGEPDGRLAVTTPGESGTGVLVSTDAATFTLRPGLAPAAATVLPVGSSWLAWATGQTAAILVPTDPARSGLPARVLLVAEIRFPDEDRARTRGETYTWSQADAAWVIAGRAPAADFIPAPLPAPADLTAAADGTGLSWTAPDAEGITGYRVTLSLVGGSEDRVRLLGPEVTSLALDLPAGDYLVRVQALTAELVGPAAAVAFTVPAA